MFSIDEMSTTMMLTVIKRIMQMDCCVVMFAVAGKQNAIRSTVVSDRREVFRCLERYD